MNLSFADTLYFKKENTLELILGLHRSYKSLQREVQICCELYDLTFNELIVILEIKKGFKKKIDIANKVFIREKKILNLDNKNISITKNGEELIEKTTNRINEKIINIFKKIDPKNMSGFINIIESL